MKSGEHQGLVRRVVRRLPKIWFERPHFNTRKIQMGMSKARDITGGERKLQGTSARTRLMIQDKRSN